MQNSTNMRILELLRFLYERTDENHPATVSDIIAHLNGKGIQAVRQTVYADTNALIDAGIDIVVVKSTQNQYFMGSRLFEYPELKMLTDAVASSKIISAKKSEELVQKLCRLTSTHQAEQLRQLASLSSRVKPDNEQVYYIIDAIQTAILEKRQVQFQYYEYTPEKKRVLKHGGYLYKLDPYALEWKNDHYYLIGFSYKHQRMAHFRVDRLSGIKILPSGFTPDEGFDVAGYTNKIVDMFAADRTISVELLCENKLMKTIIFMDNEMILTFMMSQAQAESESLSGNVRWGHRKNFKDGKVYYHCKNFLGYRWGADGQPEIDPEQAAIVRRIFSRFLLGHSVRQITTDLMADGIKTATGKTVWHDSVVQKMLCNEKYIGDALLQKTYIADLFTREKRVNNGELPKYYVHDCHPAIIDRETFQKVQEEIARRSSLKKTSSKAKTQLGKYCGKYVLSELLVCGECGSPYRRVIWTQKGAKRVVWRCQNRLEHGRKICKQSPTLDEGDIHDAVISAMNELFRMQAAKDAVKAGIAAVLAGEEQTLSLPAVEHQIRNLQERQLELFQLIVSAGADCTDYDEELQQVYMAKTKLMAQKAELEKEHRGAAAFDSRLAELDMALEQASGALTDFDELTVRQLVSNIKVLDKDSLLICFKDGTEITQTIQRRRSA